MVVWSVSQAGTQSVFRALNRSISPINPVKLNLNPTPTHQTINQASKKSVSRSNEVSHSVSRHALSPEKFPSQCCFFRKTVAYGLAGIHLRRPYVGVMDIYKYIIYIYISHVPSIQALSHCFQVLCLQQGNCTQSCFGFCAPTVWG